MPSARPRRPRTRARQRTPAPPVARTPRPATITATSTRKLPGSLDKLPLRWSPRKRSGARVRSWSRCLLMMRRWRLRQGRRGMRPAGPQPAGGGGRGRRHRRRSWPGRARWPWWPAAPATRAGSPRTSAGGGTYRDRATGPALAGPADRGRADGHPAGPLLPRSRAGEGGRDRASAPRGTRTSRTTTWTAAASAPGSRWTRCPRTAAWNWWPARIAGRGSCRARS